ncbi:Rap guanine nucleotide exchange factor 1 [Geodia barretti]|nr:Rap guanine nucleotide exchange factor 1 [Geodia barretti]
MVPVRLDSIIPRGALHNEAAPPKPPRSDRPASMDQLPQPTSNEVVSAIRAVRRYNEDLMKGQAETGGEEKAPPIPLKKKTVMLYKEIVKGYHFDDTLMQPLYIPMAECGPPALPPKKRKSRRQVPSVGRRRDEHSGGSGVDKRSSSDDQRSSVASSVEDLADDTDAEDINYLELEDTSGSLIFHKEEDGGYTLRGGPLDALIAYAASTTSAVKQFTEAFLLTYYTFITPEKLISKLLSRLYHFYKQGNKPVWTATISLLVRLLNNLNQPLVQEAEVRLIEMVHQMLSDGNLKFAQLLRNALVTKLNQLIPVNTKTAPLVGPGFKSNRKFAVTDFSPEEIARQMTVLDNELFQKVDVSEMLYWAKEQNEEKSPMLTHFTMHFNNVSQWTKTRILERGVDMRVRVKVVIHFVGIMKALRDIFNNFNSYLAILSAIESSPVSRLDWPDRVIKSLEEPRALIDNKGSFKNYREAFARAKPPCIPYIGLYLQDLTFIEMQPKLLEDGVSVNFTKRWKQFKSVDHIRFAQTKQYNFDPNPDILSLFSNFEDFASDEELWTFSNEIKPSARAQRVVHS